MQEVTSPRVTVLMGVYNGAEYLRQAVDSILGQTFRDFEFLIINDGSTDDTLAILNSYFDPRLRVISNEENIGLTRSLNKGLGLARAELIARQDADDVSHPVRLEKQVAFMESHPEIVVVGTQSNFINSSGGRLCAQGWNKLESEVGVRWELMFNTPFVHTSVMFRHSIVWNIEGGYDERFVTSQDFELWSRLARRNKIRNMAESLVDLRLHGNSISANYSAQKIIKVRQLLRDNLKWNLPDFQGAEEWSDIWLGLNNRHLHEIETDGRQIFRHLAEIYRQFAARFPEARESSEIRTHLAGLLLRAAFSQLGPDMAGALFLVRKARHFSAVAVAAAMPKLLVNILRSKVIGRQMA